MAYDGQLLFDTRVDEKGFDKGVSSIKDKADSLIKGLGALLSAGAIMKGMVDIGKQSVALASDLKEVQNVVDVTFGDGAAQIETWAKNAGAAFGLSELSAKQFTGTMGAMLKSSGVAEDQLLEMSTALVGLSGDFASFFNLASEDAFAKIRAGISGETEPLKQLGINMSVANLEAFALSQGIEKSYNSMSQAEQVMLRYNYLLSVSADASGDFARTADSLANQQRITELAIKNVGVAIGNKLMPAMTKATTCAGELAGEMANAINERGIIGAITTITDKVPLATSAVTGLASAYGLLKVIKTVSALHKEYKITMGLATTASQLGGAAILAEAGAITTKETVLLALAGKLKLATAAQVLFNTALEANPIMVVASFIGATIGALVLLDKTIRKNNESYREACESVKEVSQALKEQEEAAEDASNAFNESIKATEKQCVKAEILVAKLFELEAAYTGTRYQQEQMQRICDELNATIEGANVSFDAQTGAVNKTRDALLDYVKAAKEAARTQAITNRLTAAYEQQADAVYNLEKANQAHREASANGWKGYNTITMGKVVNNLNDAKEAATEAAKSVEYWESQLGTATEATETFTTSTESLATAVAEEVAPAIESVVIGGMELSDVLEKTGMTADEAARRFEAYSNSGSNMFDKISEKSKHNAKNVTKTMQHNAQVFENWGENIVRLGERLPSDLLGPLVEQGPQEMAGFIANLAGASEKDLIAMVDAWANMGEAGRKAFLASLTEGGEGEELANPLQPMLDAAGASIENGEFAEIGKQAKAQIMEGFTNNGEGAEGGEGDEISAVAFMTGIKSSMEAAVTEAGFDAVGASIATDVVNALNAAYADVQGAGSHLMSGFIAGMESKRGSVMSKARSIAQAAAAVIKAALQIHSPSRVTYELGEFFVDGFVNAIKDGIKGAERMSSELSAVSVDAVTKPVNQMNIREAMPTMQTIDSRDQSTFTQIIQAKAQTPSELMAEAIRQRKRAVILGNV